ncbi:PAS domain-containing protein [Hephaestia sp. GCM10023244]|uniref:PAS domain-containing protein n=1 Tax=unclassified Hephaestia TaxID=2631281 RepID=UPI002076E139|nr:PAS domain-containing protein [Hephaestia sp. MAHUQ-44]MCM8729992.1 PAS domain-containing protein [Hephaestia sp. MAHUQ-44]
MSIETMRVLRSADRVSASQLVRRFGHWQNIANERPVFVLHHGNPRWALMSMPLLSSLTDEADRDARAARLAALHDITLDHMRNMMIVLDSGLVITAINAAARAHFSVSEQDAVGGPLDAIMPETRRALLADAAARVRDTGVGESFDFESGLFVNRRLRARFAPFDHGVVLFLEDMSLADDLAAVRTSADGLAALCAASGRVATGRLTARGLIDDAPDSLAKMVGVGHDQLHGMRLTSIVDVADRPVVNAAIDLVFEHARQTQIATTLLRHGAEPVPVTLALARTDTPHGSLSARYMIVDGSPPANAQPTG